MDLMKKTNLYHLLCGAVFDGSLFDYLSKHNQLVTSRFHSSGIDYIITVYEKCPELDSFSNHLLCSYNRFSDGTRALQSFGILMEVESTFTASIVKNCWAQFLLYQSSSK